jgi:hypothetical protein
MIAFENPIRIDRPLSGVFGFATNPSNYPSRNYYVLRVEKTSDGPDLSGATFRQVRRNHWSGSPAAP